MDSIGTCVELRHPRMDWRTHLATEIIKRDLAEPLNVTSLAGHVGLSRSRFTHLFCTDVGVGPAQYLRRARLQRAADLLRETQLPVRETMNAVGIKDPGRFARDFRGLYGVSPRNFRAQARLPGGRAGYSAAS
jgi:transcriptional regulator GlxA family with amidase domain